MHIRQEIQATELAIVSYRERMLQKMHQAELWVDILWHSKELGTSWYAMHGNTNPLQTYPLCQQQAIQ